MIRLHLRPDGRLGAHRHWPLGQFSDVRTPRPPARFTLVQIPPGPWLLCPDACHGGASPGKTGERFDNRRSVTSATRTCRTSGSDALISFLTRALVRGPSTTTVTWRASRKRRKPAGPPGGIPPPRLS